MKQLLFLFLVIPNFLFSQIKVDKAGDGWDYKIDSAINLIRETSTRHYAAVLDVVNKVEFWNTNYSSNNLIEGKGVVVIAVQDVKLSVANLAAVLVHESFHLFCLKYNVQYSPRQEELLAYSFELSFLEMLPGDQFFLINHAKQQIENYK